MSDFVPDVVNSFQGSFGPPTVGHFHAMLLSAKNQLTDYPDKNILMLFMPTYKSGSKPHLEPTYDVRIALLEEYCKNDAKITKKSIIKY
jgi:nicotinic acid mononucleotide adenylyltransferase